MKEKIKVAFICPLYDFRNHFDLGLNLYSSKMLLGVKENIYFVFSNKSQCEKFDNKIYECFRVHINALIIPEDLLNYKSPVTVKKFYALNELADKYSYLAVIDSESKFVRKGDFAFVFNEIWNNGTMLNANISPDGFFILRRCFKTLGINKNKILCKELKHFKYNIWFNEIPIYKTETLKGFFDWLKQFDKDKYLNDFFCFDYYIYMAYLILELGFHVKRHNYIGFGGVIENIYMYFPQKQKRIMGDFQTHWSSHADTINENTYILFHLDRYKKNIFSIRSKGYGYNHTLQVVKEYISWIEVFIPILREKISFILRIVLQKK